MRHRISDRTWACIAAASLLGIAAFIIFVIHPGGFEGQRVWLFALLPGTIPAMFLSDIVSRLAHRAEPVIYDALIAIFNFAWYWGISFVVIKIFRAGGWELGSPEF
jgi:hypothetical protein